MAWDVKENSVEELKKAQAQLKNIKEDIEKFKRIKNEGSLAVEKLCQEYKDKLDKQYQDKEQKLIGEYDIKITDLSSKINENIKLRENNIALSAKLEGKEVILNNKEKELEKVEIALGNDMKALDNRRKTLVQQESLFDAEKIKTNRQIDESMKANAEKSGMLESWDRDLRAEEKELHDLEKDLKYRIGKVGEQSISIKSQEESLSIRSSEVNNKQIELERRDKDLKKREDDVTAREIEVEDKERKVVMDIDFMLKDKERVSKAFDEAREKEQSLSEKERLLKIKEREIDEKIKTLKQLRGNQ